MEVILVQDVDKFGKSGSVVKVKDGFARNFLFPHNLAIPATSVNLKRLAQERKRVECLQLREKEQALELSNRLDGMSVTIPVQIHDDDKLYGSISTSEIVTALHEEGIAEVTKDAVILDELIKLTGVYDITIKLHPEVTAKIKLWVVKR